MDLYAKAGAKYFFSMGVHHDNFDMWNSKYQPRWNAAATGPKKDIVGIWKIAARKRGLRFGVSEHLSNSFDWFAPAHTTDATGPLAGVPYDGTLPAYADLYHDYTGMPADFAKTAKDMGRVAPDRWKHQYFNRIKDLIDQHQPDLLYTDGGIPFDEYGLSLVADLYNISAAASRRQSRSRLREQDRNGLHHRHLRPRPRARRPRRHLPRPWQTDTCIGEWHYKRGIQYKSAKKVIDLLVDIVSKNGNLLLNFPLPNSGELDADETRHPRGHHRMDGRQQRRHLRHPPLEDLRRRPLHQGRHPQQTAKSSTPTRARSQTSPPKTFASPPRATPSTPSSRAGLEGQPSSPLSAQQPAKSTKDHQRSPPRLHATPPLHPGATGLKVTFPSDPIPTGAIGVTLKLTTT